MKNQQIGSNPTDFRCGDQELYRIIRNEDGKVINYVWAQDAQEAWEKARDGGMSEIRVEPEKWYWRAGMASPVQNR